MSCLKKLEKIIVYLFIDTYKSNNIKISKNEIRVTDSEMCVMKQRGLVNTAAEW